MYDNIQKHYPGFLFFAKIVILVMAYKLISDRILDENSYEFFFEGMKKLESGALPVVLALLGMSLLNSYLEAVKWKCLASKIRPIALADAWKQSLSSLTASLITPNRIGEYGAKALYFPRRERSRVVLYNFIGNFSQMGATLFFGSMGLWKVYDQVSGLGLGRLPWWRMGLLLAAPIVGAVLLNRMWSGFYARLVDGMRSVRNRVLLESFFLSLIKYLVFAHQFLFLLVVFGVDLDYLLCMSLISISYLVASIIPGFVLFDWLVKGSVAVTVFAHFGVDELLVLSITSLMWLLNFGLPSLIGSYYVLTYRKSALATQKSSVLK